MIASFVHDASLHRLAQACRYNLCMSSDLRTTIQKLMSEQGISQRRLAELGKIDQPSLSKFLSGVTADLQVSTLRAIATVLGTTTSQLLGETEYLADPKIARVVHAMEKMPEYKKDAVVATSSALSKPAEDGGLAA